MSYFTREGQNDSFVGEGEYRVITKCQAGYMVTSVVKAKSPIHAFRQYKPKAIQSIAFIKTMSDGSVYEFTVYARAGKKVWASEEFLSEVTVGDINQDLSNTALYNQFQYSGEFSTMGETLMERRRVGDEWLRPVNPCHLRTNPVPEQGAG